MTLAVPCGEAKVRHRVSPRELACAVEHRGVPRGHLLCGPGPTSNKPEEAKPSENTWSKAEEGHVPWDAEDVDRVAMEGAIVAGKHVARLAMR